ncbi:MAG TPA: hypothetical protein PK079_18115 [Leptospiraceae bacterium]|nr:hypothetical protein [Leptospiraceae bacterium]HMW07991.1 hypothetical protein [Leptospiraceae bacterium]HMX33617.1 hypothetical protein [Leptospiraceae bacterium]HMY33788.1 hypothetical protein [Leptospiraceae bacterium]HMZ64838.1 hypothetical protein [Leptospiraceae bacterium]
MSIQPIDPLVLFTDRIFEPFNNSSQEYGDERLYDFLLNSQKLPMNEVFTKLIADVDPFFGEKIR